MSKILQISPCSGWVHVSGADGDLNIHRVASWAVLDNGEVVGLVPVSAAGRAQPNAKLVPAPDGGRYCLEEQLNVTEQLHLRLN